MRVNALLLLAAAVAATLAASVRGESVPLHDGDFDSVVGQDEAPWFIKFYAPWCSHCRRLAPTWKQFAEAMQGESSTHIGEVDCTKETGLAKRFSIQGYPTILHISHVEGREVVRQYAGPRTVDGFSEFVSGGWATQAEAEQTSFLEEVQSFAMRHTAMAVLMVVVCVLVLFGLGVLVVDIFAAQEAPKRLLDPESGTCLPQVRTKSS